MRKLFYAAAGAAALATTSMANAAITIGATGTDAGSILTVSSPDNVTIPNTVSFDTTSNAAGTYTSFFDFSNDQTGMYNFSLTSSTLGATVTLAQLLGDGGSTILQSVSGSAAFLNLLTGDLTAGTTYRFSYTSTLPTGGGVVSGNASFFAATAVPEPATWAMLLLGFAGIGLTIRRRRPAFAQVA